MDYKRREEIFSKEALNIADVCDIFGISKSEACKKIQEIKRCVGDRLRIQGKIHIQDYFDYYQIKDKERYKKALILEEEKYSFLGVR